MLILPIGHDTLVVERLPFATFGIGATCLLVFFLLWGRADEEAHRKQQLLERIEVAWRSEDALSLPPKLLETLPEHQKAIEKTRADWLAWYRENPHAAMDWIDRRDGEKSHTDEPEDSRESGGALGALVAQKTSDDAKAAFIERVREVGLAEIESRQAELDGHYESYRQLSREGLLGRFGYVPDYPRLTGLLTHMFLHGGVMHLVFNLLFLWVAAVKLENIWGHFWFLGLYLVFGIAGALFHHAAHPDSSVPLIGASGAVAGLMGAFAVRLAKSKIRFFYAYWFFQLTPRHGTFEAPAYLMLPLWFTGELFSALLFDVGPVAYWAHVGGFVTGAFVALVFRLTDFEKKILGRDPDEEPEDPDAAPLVAFQPVSTVNPISNDPMPGSPAAMPTKAPSKMPIEPSRFAIRELGDISVDHLGLSGRVGMQPPVHVGRDEIKSIAAARVDRLDPTDVETFIDSGLAQRQEPAYFILLVRATSDDRAPRIIPAYIVDGARLKYEKLLSVAPGMALRKDKAFVAFVKTLLQRFPKAGYVPGTGAVGEHNLPLYADLESFLSSVRKFVLKQQARGS